MTLIVGLARKGEVWIGGDSYLEHNLTSFVLQRPKVFRKLEPNTERPVLIGLCGDAMLLQIVEFGFEVTDRPDGQDVFRHVLEGIAQPLLDAVSARADVLQLKGDEFPKGRFLIGYEGRLFIIDNQFYCVETKGGENAIGAGEDAAMGCLFATKRLAAEKRVKLALEAGAHFNSAVSAPFHIEKL